MAWLSDNGKIIPESQLRLLRAEQEKKRALEEAAAIEAAKKMGLLDEVGNPVGETEEPPSPAAEVHVSGWPTDEHGNLLEPPTRKPAGTNGTAAHPPVPGPDLYETVEIIRRLVASEEDDPAEVLATIVDVVSNRQKYRLGE